MYCVIIECLITTTVTYCSSSTARTAGCKPRLKVGDGVKAPSVKLSDFYEW